MKKTNKNNVKVTVKTKPTALGCAGLVVLGGAVIGSTVRNIKSGVEFAKDLKRKYDEKKKKDYLDEGVVDDEDDFFDDMEFDDYDEQEEK